MMIKDYFKEHGVRFVVTLIALGVWTGISLYMNGFVGGDSYVYDENGQKVVEQGFAEVVDSNAIGCLKGMAQYKVHNRWPRSTAFYQEKWGIIDIATGEDTGPVFADFLHFCINENAWDYAGHYVDRKGNVIMTNNYYLENDKWIDNPLKFSLAAFSEGTLEYYADDLQLLRNENHLRGPFTEYIDYYSNGYAAYLGRGDRWGYINMDGEMEIEPTFSRAYWFDENGYAIVGIPRENDRAHIQYAIIDKDFANTHEYALEPDDYHEIFENDDGSFLAFKFDNEDGMADAEMDAKGNVTYKK